MLKTISSCPLISFDAVVLDTETTGLDAETARIIQIGAVRFAGGKIQEDKIFDTLVNPGQAIPPESVKIHHITDEDVASAPAFPEIAAEVESFIEHTVVVGHNIGFDLTILKNEYRRGGRTWRCPRALDTALLARAARPTLHDFSLDMVAEWLGIEIEGRHQALGDAVATARVLERLIPMLAGQDIRTLAEAEKVCRSFADADQDHVRQGWTGPVVGPDERADHPAALARVDSFPYRHRVKEIMSAPPVFVAAGAMSDEISQTLATKNVSSVFVEPDGAGGDHGIITERDLMRVLTAGDAAAPTARELMSAPLKMIAEDAFVYQAIALMSRAGFRHLGVHDEEGALVGALTSGDLLRQRAQDALVLGDEIDHAENVSELAAIWARLPLVARSMMDESVRCRDIAAIIAEETCALTRRAVQLAERDMQEAGRGPAPRSYCTLVLGSGGRGETLLSPDQDNAIIYENGPADEAVDAWFAELGDRFATILDRVGLPYCNGGVMAKNADWRQDVDGWQERIGNWLRRAETTDLWHVDIFYDFRCVHGERALALEVRHFAYESAGRAPGFLRNLSAMATDFRAPITVFGGIKTDHGRVDLKKHGLLAVVSGARVLALRHGIEKRATKDRLEAVAALGAVNAQDLQNIVDAHEILQSEVLRQQLEDIEAGEKPSSRVDPKRLGKRRAAALKWALEQVDVIKTMVGDPMAFG